MVSLGQKKTASTSWAQQHKSQSLDWELDTVNSSPTSTDWKFPIQTNIHAAQVLKPLTTSYIPAPPSPLWDARPGPVQWMPTGSFGNKLRHCGRLRTSPYSPDWRSGMAGNAEEEGDGVFLWLFHMEKGCKFMCVWQYGSHLNPNQNQVKLLQWKISCFHQKCVNAVVETMTVFLSE